MPLQIIRNDITKVRADAIVNATNVQLIPGGTGVDAAIHAAAGPNLAQALEKFRPCPEGKTVVTGSFNISCCKYIIHTPTPLFVDGSQELLTLRQCYQNVLKSATELKCTSIAIPILSAGSMGVPMSEAYSIATSSIREFLLKEDSELTVFLVVFSKDALIVTAKLHDAVEHYIDDNYVDEKKSALREQQSNYGRANLLRPMQVFRPRPEWREEEELICSAPCNTGYKKHEALSVGYSICESDASIEAAPCECEESIKEVLPKEAPETENYRDQDLSFGEMCAWWMRTKNIDVGTFYCDANITRATFHNIKAHPGMVPKKTTALACVVGLKLKLEEAQDLLMRGGLALSPYNKTDVVVRFFIEKENYDIDTINAELYDNDLALLGSAAG